MSDVRNRSFLIRLAFDPILKSKLWGIQNSLACGKCLDWHLSKIYFSVPLNLSKVEDLVELVKAEHGIQSGIFFKADGFSIPLHTAIENLKEIKEPIEVVPIGPGVPKVHFPRCNCAAAVSSDQVNEMVLKLSGTNIQEKSNGSQGGVLDQSDDPNGDNVASGSSMTHVSNSTAQESLSTQGTYGSEESGKSTGSEDMGSVMAKFPKEKADETEQSSAVCGSENTSTFSLEHSKVDGQSDNSSAEWTTVSTSAEERIESGENGDEKEVPERELDVEEDSSSEMVVEAAHSKAANILEGNMLEERHKRSGYDLSSEEMGIPEKKTRTHAMILDSGVNDDESLAIRELLTGETVLSGDAEKFDEGPTVMSSTPKPSKGIPNGTSQE